MKVYRIRQKSTGHYKQRGSWWGFNKEGDIFNSVAHCRSTITRYCNNVNGNAKNDFEIVEFELVEVRTYE